MYYYSDPDVVLKCQIAVASQTFLTSKRGRKEDLGSTVSLAKMENFREKQQSSNKEIQGTGQV